ncbi:histidine kinase dimerization/phospho-acceptor domain-containing protein [Sphingomonas sp. PsM26]|nr:histidine kinase dimerization/phospho-acceptor domain-containing protein [Sphingomonas sp. PsM26]
MRFDDSLETVLSGDMTSPIGAQLAWRQLVDLIGRGRAPANDDVIARLRMIRGSVPPPVRTASARAIADEAPPLALVMVFAEDEIAVAAPVLRGAQLAPADWAELLPLLSPTGRSILRHRRDLAGEVVAMLASFGSVDFVLAPPETVDRAEEGAAPDERTMRCPASDDAGTVAGAIFGVAETPAQAGENPPGGSSDIAEMLKRIAAYQRTRAATLAERSARPAAPEQSVPSDQFDFEADASGTIRWVDGIARAALVGISLAQASSEEGVSGVDGAVAEAFRARADFQDLRLFVAGRSEAAGTWQISAGPVFDGSTGGFNGFRGTASRADADDLAAPPVPNASAVADALRQLVHELRTPTNAIAGFAEMIETEMLGPVAETYREHATDIRHQTADLLGAIEDMDTAAREETVAGQPLGERVSVTDMLDRIATDLAPLATLRGATIALHGLDETLCIAGDGRVVERLIGRLLATLVAAARARDQIGVVVSAIGPDRIRLVFDRPRGLASDTDEDLATTSADAPDDADSAPTLGTGFALRLIANLASELGGGLDIGREALTLQLPTRTTRPREQTSRR